MSNLYMTTEEFADMVVQTLHDQNYFKKGDKHHPGDIVIAFVSAAESIGSAMEWAIQREFQVKKQGMMQATTLSKNNHYADTENSSRVTFSPNRILPQDEEIAPSLLEQGEPLVDEDWVMGYSEWKKSGKPKKVK